MNFILSLLKNPKIISAILGVAVSFGAVWYGINLIQEKGALEERLIQAQQQLELTRDSLESERERFDQTIENYNELMSNYLNRIADTDQRTQSLRSTIDRLSRENQELEQCFNMDAPEELLNELFRERNQ